MLDLDYLDKIFRVQAIKYVGNLIIIIRYCGQFGSELASLQACKFTLGRDTGHQQRQRREIFFPKVYPCSNCKIIKFWLLKAQKSYEYSLNFFTWKCFRMFKIFFF